MRGLDLEREAAEQLGNEWQFGAASPLCVFSVPIDKRPEYLPRGEAQNIGEEKQGCVTRAYLNILETKFTYALRNNIIKPENAKWLRDHGYTVFNNGSEYVEFSDAFIEILSGTTRQGNSLKAPAQAIHSYGLLPKNLLPQLDTFDDHHNPDRITGGMKILGLDFLKRFKINYEQVDNSYFEQLLKMDMENIAVHAWPAIEDGEYPAILAQFNHAVMAFALPKTYIFDNYKDAEFDGIWIKKLKENYKMLNYGYRIYIAEEVIPKSIIQAIFDFIYQMTGIKLKPDGTRETPPEPQTKPDYMTDSKLLTLAKENLGKDVSPKDLVSDNFGCAESLSTLIKQIIPTFPVVTGTWTLYDLLRTHKGFEKVTEPEPGDIILCVTGMGKGTIANGHAGVVSNNGFIMSNDSQTGLWKENFTPTTWKHRYVFLAKYPIFYYRLKADITS